MKYIFPLSILIFCVSCKTSPYIKASLDFKKISDNCAGLDPAFSMNSNTNGERFEFEDCLVSNFDGKNFATERKGDTILIQLPRKGDSHSLFKLTLDLDAYPQYQFITIGENTYMIGTAKP